ncbi:hypothetical protein IJ380_00875 [Candidatus Saccharibacteria bacterium]|nr:hypothetical protein [Candidatus Saccharibacteria bacterium]
MKKILALILVSVLAFSFSTAAFAEGNHYPSPSAEELRAPASHVLSESTVSGDFATLWEASGKDVDKFAEALGFEQGNIEGTIYSRDFCLTRDETTFHVLTSGNVIWILFEGYGDMLVVGEIVTSPEKDNSEVVARVLYYLATETRVDLRKIELPYDLRFWVYADENLPLDEKGRIDMSLIDVLTIMNLGTTKATF